MRPSLPATATPATIRPPSAQKSREPPHVWNDEGSFEKGIEDSAFSKLPLTFTHAAALVDLPMYHRDLFDRMLIVQAKQEDLTIVTADRRFEPYDVSIVWT